MLGTNPSLYKSSPEQIWREFRENLSHNVGVDLAKSGVNKKALARSFLIEGYLHGKLAVHFHGQLAPSSTLRNFIGCKPSQSRDVGERCDYCAIVYRTRYRNSPILAQFENGLPRGDRGQVEFPVFVFITKLMEEPERMKRRAVSSIVRLQSLNYCLSVTMQGSDLEEAPPCGSPILSNLPLFRPILADRKFTVGTVMSVDDREVTNEMVKKRAEIVETVPDDEAQPDGRRRGSKANPENPFSALYLNLHNASLVAAMGDEEGVHFSPESLEVLLCPLELSLQVNDRIKSSGHMLDSTYGHAKDETGEGSHVL